MHTNIQSIPKRRAHCYLLFMLAILVGCSTNKDRSDQIQGGLTIIYKFNDGVTPGIEIRLYIDSMEASELGDFVRKACESTSTASNQKTIRKGSGFEEITIEGRGGSRTLCASFYELQEAKNNRSPSQEASMVWVIREEIRQALADRYDHSW